MKNLLLSSVLVLSLSGCLMPSGVNPSLGCSTFNGCTSKDYYLPGKGVWAPKRKFGPKATVGAILGSVGGYYVGSKGGSVLSTAIGSVVGLTLGYQVGATFDKVDQMHGAMLMQRVLDHPANGQYMSWHNPDKPVSVASKATSINATCREFVTKVTVNREVRQVRGTACKRNGEWEVKEMY